MDPIVSTSPTASGPEPKRVNSDRAVGWITDAWALFSKAPGPWVLVAAVALLIMIVASQIPLLGSIFVSGIVTGSLMVATAILFQIMMNPVFGSFNEMLRATGIPTSQWLSDPDGQMATQR